MSDTDRYKRYFFTAHVSQVNLKTMKTFFEQRSELQVAKCLIVHVMSSIYNVSRIELRKKRKQRSNGHFVSPKIFYAQSADAFETNSIVSNSIVKGLRLTISYNIYLG